MYAVAARLTPSLYLDLAGRRTPRWRWPATRWSASSTMCTTGRTARHTRTRMRWGGRSCRRRPTRASGSPCWTRVTWPGGSPVPGTSHWPPNSAASATVTSRPGSVEPTPDGTGPSATATRAAPAGCVWGWPPTRSERCPPGHCAGSPTRRAITGCPSTSTCPSSPRRTTLVTRDTAAPPRNCSRPSTRSVLERRSFTPRISRPPISRRSVAPRRSRASVRPPNAISPTASARRVRSSTPAPGWRSGRISTRSSTRSRNCVGSSRTNDSSRDSGDGSLRTNSCGRARSLAIAALAGVPAAGAP
jgi:hypothetical protein